MVESLEYLIFQLLANDVRPVRSDRKLIFSFNSQSNIVQPPGIQTVINKIKLPKAGELNLYTYESTNAEDVFYTIMLANPERFELNEKLIKELIEIDEPGFQSIYLKSYYSDLLPQVHDEWKNRKSIIMQELPSKINSLQSLLNCMAEIEFAVDSNTLIEKLTGFKFQHLQLITFDGIEGDDKELIFRDNQRFYQLQFLCA